MCQRVSIEEVYAVGAGKCLPGNLRVGRGGSALRGGEERQGEGGAAVLENS